MSSMSDIFRVIEHTVPSHRQNDALVLSVKQYIPLDNPNPRSDDVTIIGAPGNGHVKELYEPLWEELYHRSKTAGFRIRSIWIADGTHQGKSGLLNDGRLQNDGPYQVDWLDHSHDLRHLINLKHADMPGPIVGIGHSMGGTQLAYLSLLQPHLLHSLILIEPGIDEPSPTSAVQQGIARCAQLSLNSPDIWPSIQAAQEFTARNPLFQTWDPRVVRRWLHYGLRNVSSTGTGTAPSLQQHNHSTAIPVTLTTPRHQEMLVYKRPTESLTASSDSPPSRNTHSPYYRPEPHRVLSRLPHLQPSTLYLIGGRSPLCAPHLRELRLRYTGTGVGGSGGAVCGRVREVHVSGRAHSLGLEGVVECADESASWLGGELERWRQESYDREGGKEGGEAVSRSRRGIENNRIRSRL